jgi:DeoR/GlpR family transcriptional regulator of sugar metabolism
MKQALLKRAVHKVLIADTRKWNKPASVRFAPWSEFEAWVTDADANAVRAVRKLGPRVISVDKEQGQNG